MTYVSVRKNLMKFSKLLRPSVSVLTGEIIQDNLSFQTSPRSTRCPRAMGLLSITFLNPVLLPQRGITYECL